MLLAASMVVLTQALLALLLGYYKPCDSGSLLAHEYTVLVRISKHLSGSWLLLLF
jgi:hypothetical protein